MLPSFLSLPRELRDLIYEYVLVSPTGYLCPIIPNAAKQRTISKPSRAALLPRKRIQLLPCEPSFGLVLPHTSGINVSLIRTSRQIHAETQSLLWSRNTLCFTEAQEVAPVLKTMGQGGSRKVQKVCLLLDGVLKDKKAFGRAMGMLASRTRRGCLREVSLRIGLEVVLDIASTWVDPNGYDVRSYDDLLYMLQSGEHAGWQKGTRRELCVQGPTEKVEVPEELLRQLHYVWGGRLVFDGGVLWEDFVKL